MPLVLLRFFSTAGMLKGKRVRPGLLDEKQLSKRRWCKRYILAVCTEFAPIASPSAAERFSSPAAGTGAKRRLFDSGEGTASNSSGRRAPASDTATQPVPIPMVLVADKKGRQVTCAAGFVTSVCICSAIFHCLHSRWLAC